MDLILEDLIRIVIFLAIVIWYIYSLISRAKKANKQQSEQSIEKEEYDSPYSKNIKEEDAAKYTIKKDNTSKKIFSKAFFPFIMEPEKGKEDYKEGYYEKEKVKSLARKKENAIQKLKQTKEQYKKSNIPTKNIHKRKRLTFANNVIVQGFIFSEIIGKPRSIE